MRSCPRTAEDSSQQSEMSFWWYLTFGSCEILAKKGNIPARKKAGFFGILVKFRLIMMKKGSICLYFFFLQFDIVRKKTEKFSDTPILFRF